MHSEAMTAFDDAFEHTVGQVTLDGGYSADHGGATAYGITEAVARKEAEISEPIALKLFDMGVNLGIGTAAKFLQRTLNALNRQQADYADGAIGPNSVTAFVSFMNKRKP
ncbi:hypothetical protein K457DRAFT_125464 [Linnemannia elongata AG-77]|uniref:Uncharacterized protein n=1 Tax=Linnemannia elongata AG-77 TaxID=1314771 RepID=A0A197JZH6_9FUNG|nr:hypothetical protein K457DRAFT_125464 [Linnemannia elongata AG-77]